MNDFLTYMVEKLNRQEPPSHHGISWNISPKINAVFRNGDIDTKRTLFQGFTGEVDKAEALKVANRCHRQQTERVKQIVEDMQDSLQEYNSCVIGFVDNEDKEYTGLIASRLAGKYHKTAFVLREMNSTTYSGSMRSPYEMADMLNESGLIKVQGHSSAAGVFLKKSNFKKFIKWMEEQDFDSAQGATPVTACLEPKLITLDLCHICADNKALFAKGVEAPTFYLKIKSTPTDLSIYRKASTTIKFTYPNVEILKFRATEEEDDLLSNNVCEIEMIVSLSVNEWNGAETAQAIVEEWEIRKVEDEDDVDWEEIF